MSLRSALEELARGVPEGGAVTVPVNWLRRLMDEDPHDDGGPDLDVQEAGRRVGRQPSTVRTWCAEGRLAGAYRLGGREWRIPRSALTAFVRSHEASGEGGQARPGSDEELGGWRDHFPKAGGRR